MESDSPQSQSFSRSRACRPSPEHGVANIARLVHVENDDRNLVIHAKAEGGRVHHLQPFGQRFGVADLLVALRVRVHVRVAIVNAVDFGRLQDNVRPDFARAQSRGRVGRKIRVAGAGDENDDAAQFKMPDGPAEDERLGDIFHFDRGLDPRRRRRAHRARSAGRGR